MFEMQGFLGEISKKSKSVAKEEDLVMLSHILCKTYGWDYYTLMKQPIPFIFSLLSSMEREYKIQEKEIEKSKKKR